MHILSVSQFDCDFITKLFDRAKDCEDRFVPKPRGPGEIFSVLPNPRFLKNRVMANLFYEPSTRTSSSFYSAMVRCGGSVIPINDVTFSSVTKGENLDDTIRTLGCYADVIVLRYPEIGGATRASLVSPVPIINAGDGAGEHPTQALLDLYTIFREKGRLDNLRIGMIGDLKYGRTVHSLTKLLRLYDSRLMFFSPKELKMPEELVVSNDMLLGDWELGLESLNEVIEHLDVLYVTRVQKERIDDLASILSTGKNKPPPYSITPQSLLKAKPDLTIMHPLPRLNELSPELDLDPRAAYFRQMKNGLWIRMALLEEILSGQNYGHWLGDRN